MIRRFMIASHENSQIRSFLNSRVIFMECTNLKVFFRTFHRVHIWFIANCLEISTTYKSIYLYSLLFFDKLHSLVDFFKIAMKATLKCNLRWMKKKQIKSKIYVQKIMDFLLALTNNSNQRIKRISPTFMMTSDWCYSLRKLSRN